MTDYDYGVFYGGWVSPVTDRKSAERWIDSGQWSEEDIPMLVRKPRTEWEPVEDA